ISRKIIYSGLLCETVERTERKKRRQLNRYFQVCCVCCVSPVIIVKAIVSTNDKSISNEIIHAKCNRDFNTTVWQGFIPNRVVRKINSLIQGRKLSLLD